MFVISGWLNKKINIKDETINMAESLDNIKVLGYVTDSELKCLIEKCKFFLFPSIYEGFGLPPLEALGLGANVLVGDIPVMREVLDNAVTYIDPYNFNSDVKDLEEITYKKRDRVLKKYSWAKGAEQLYQLLH